MDYSNADTTEIDLFKGRGIAIELGQLTQSTLLSSHYVPNDCVE
jgi:hypothetical protein